MMFMSSPKDGQRVTRLSLTFQADKDLDASLLEDTDWWVAFLILWFLVVVALPCLTLIA